jgi:D-3-phosphoglycerate dehydrogenase / 2-oxoglutarate reductase
MAKLTPSRKILTINNIARVGLARFPREHYEVGSKVDAPDAIIVRSQNMHDMEIPVSVMAIGRAGAGVNNIPVDKLSKHGMPVFNAPGANANAVKELVIAAMLMASRNIAPALKFVEGLSGDDKTLHKLVEDGKKAFSGSELPGRALGVIGLGKIGSLVADAAIRLGMDVIGYDPHITVDAAWSLPSQVRKANSIEELLRGADYVSVHVPLVEATRNLLDTKRLALMKKSAILLNFARDGIVDDNALVAAIQSNNLRGYFCDFPAQALLGVPRVYATPHLGASTEEAEDNCAVMVADQIRDFLEHGNVRNAVNFPDAIMARESLYRLSIANANVPNMLGQISTVMADAALNIHNMLNKSRGEMAYTLVDVDSPIPTDLLDRLDQIKGVLAVRYLPLEA